MDAAAAAAKAKNEKRVVYVGAWVVLGGAWGLGLGCSCWLVVGQRVCVRA